MDAPRSAELHRRACRVIPGGVNSPVRAFGAVGGTPRFLTRGEGAHVWDEDGRRYIDLVQSWGALPLGHARPEVVAAAEAALRGGSSFGAPTRREVELAEVLCDAVPSLERVRLVSSGTEAAMSAVRLARGVTGRDRVLKFAGHYHGHSDALLADAGSGLATLGIPGSPGVTRGAAADTVVVAWNDVAALDAALDRHGGELAAIICEPVAANMTLVPPQAGFLAVLRQRADAVGAVLILDEVITGFRVARAGAQGRFGVTADLTVLGKAIGGGFPLAAFGGRAELMDRLAPAGAVYQAGTLSGNPVAVAAGLAQVGLLDDAALQRLGQLAATLADGLRGALSAVGAPASVRQLGGLVGVTFGAVEVVDRQGAGRVDHAAYARFFHALLERGVLLPPSGYEVLFPSLAHDEGVLAEVAAAAGDAAGTLAAAGTLPPT